MKKRRSTKGKRKNILLKLTCLGFLLLSSFVVTLGVVIFQSFEREFPDQLFYFDQKEQSPRLFVYDFEDRTNRIGTPVDQTESLLKQKTAIRISYGEIPTDLQNAFVSIEDKRYWDHRGVDWFRTVAAGVNYILGFSDSFGASTITQQLVKNVTGSNEVTLRRKMQEIFYALDLERSLDKSQILEWYLNIIHFSDQCDGIGEAARHYFSKTPEELSVEEMASLVAIVNNPSYYHPVRHPENNLYRRNLILSQMNTQGYLSEERYQSAVKEPLHLSLSESSGGGINSWYTDMVIEDVVNGLAEEYGISRSAASQWFWHGGLRVDIAMDPQIQEIVEGYYEKEFHAPANDAGIGAQSSMIVIDPKTGDILGVAGAVGSKKGNRVQNFATQTLRPPGSVIKPISVYGPALELGMIHWASVYDDVPFRFEGTDLTPWPKNATGVYRGLTNVSYAVAHSTNTVAVKILDEIGLERSFQYARDRFRLQSLVSSDCDYAALALGQLNYGVTLKEVSAAYTVFADGGVYHAPRSYYRVMDATGKLLLSAPDEGSVVLSAQNAAIMTKLLQGVIAGGTSSSITLDRIVECAGKTGTTNGDGDRWFVGYTPDLVCGVWCGFEYPEPVRDRNVCNNAWDTVMHKIWASAGGTKSFSVPSDVVKLSYCKDSGEIPGEACPQDPRGSRIESGWFVKGQEPVHSCQRHILVDYDEENGGVSHGFCPAESLKKIALIQVERQFPKQIYVADAQYTYLVDPTAIAPSPQENTAYYASQISAHVGRSSVKIPFHRSCPLHRHVEELEEQEVRDWFWKEEFLQKE